MRGRPPKDPALRQRRNRDTSRASLPAADDPANAKRKVPGLPPREKKTEQWHPMVLAWWSVIWKSPMAEEFLEADLQGGLFLLAELYQKRWGAENAGELLEVAKEIRQQEVRFGLSPIDRRRLQWEIEKGEQADERTSRRRQTRQASAKDPRDVLRIAK